MREPIVIGWPTTQTDTDLSLHGTCQIQGSGCVEFEEFLQWFHSHFPEGEAAGQKFTQQHASNQ